MKKIALLIQVGTFSRFEFIKDWVDTFIKNYKTDLYIACDDLPEYKEYFLSQYSKACLIGTENLGTDLGKFLQTLKTIILVEKKYDYIIKIHTKKPGKWATDLLDLLLPHTFEKVLEAFKDPKIGLVSKWNVFMPIRKSDKNIYLLKKLLKFYSKSYNFPTRIKFCSRDEISKIHKNPNLRNFKKISRADYLTIHSEYIFGSKEHLNNTDIATFTAGTMFVIRHCILESFFNLETIDWLLDNMRLNQETGYFTDFERPKWTHSLERFIGLMTFLQGYKIKGI